MAIFMLKGEVQLVYMLRQRAQLYLLKVCRYKIMVPFRQHDVAVGPRSVLPPVHHVSMWYRVIPATFKCHHRHSQWSLLLVPACNFPFPTK